MSIKKKVNFVDEPMWRNKMAATLSAHFSSSIRVPHVQFSAYSLSGAGQATYKNVTRYKL